MKILYVFTSCKKSGPTNQMLNIIKQVSDNNECFLLTTRKEDKQNSVISLFLPYVSHRLIKVSRYSAVFGRNKNIKRYIDSIRPDVIHTLGVFPDFLIEKLKYKNHIFTCRNYVYDDYIDEYGAVVGNVLAKLHIKAIKSCKNVVCCSESLQQIYLSTQGISMPFITNGVDTDIFIPFSNNIKKKKRSEFGLDLDKIVWVYTGKFNGRKNQEFLLESVLDCKHFCDSIVLLLGDGPMLKELLAKYSSYSNIMFVGDVPNVLDYLNCSDIYISSSKSEGMPNAVLEAMSCNLPVLLSNIDQHKEIIRKNDKIGLLYEAGSKTDFCAKFDYMYEKIKKAETYSASRETVIKYFSKQNTAKEYLKLYTFIAKESKSGL